MENVEFGASHGFSGRAATSLAALAIAATMVATLLVPARARAATQDSQPVAQPQAGAPSASPSTGASNAQDASLGAPAGERVNVESIQEKYWARGDESELGVVQNRLYSKEHKLELGLFTGVVETDPFLSVYSVGGSVGFHFSEYLALHFVGWKDMVGPSAALTTFQNTIGATTETNDPTFFVGSEIAASFLYGKLSVAGKAIIYYDMHLLGGVGVQGTESGNDIAPMVGIGQQVYLSKTISLRLDYRLIRYDETLLEKVITPKLGEPIGTRVNMTNSITLGVDFLFGVLK